MRIFERKAFDNTFYFYDGPTVEALEKKKETLVSLTCDSDLYNPEDLQRLTAVKSLYIREYTQILEHLPSDSLENLYIDGYIRSDKKYIEFISRFKSLKKLVIGRCYSYLNGNGLTQKALENSPESLEELYVTKDNRDIPDDFSCLHRLKNLKKISLDSDREINNFPLLPALEYFQLLTYDYPLPNVLMQNRNIKILHYFSSSKKSAALIEKIYENNPIEELGCGFNLLPGNWFEKSTLQRLATDPCDKKVNKNLVKLFEGFPGNIENKHKYTLLSLLQNEADSLDYDIPVAVIEHALNHPVKEVRDAALIELEKKHTDVVHTISGKNITVSGSVPLFKKADYVRIIEENQGQLQSKVSAKTDILVLGHKPKYTWSALPSKKIQLISCNQFVCLLQNEQLQPLNKESDESARDNLKDMLFSQDNSNVDLALEIMDKNGLPDDAISYIFSVFKAHPQDKIRKKARGVLGKYPNAITDELMAVCGKRNYLSMSGDGKPEKDFAAMKSIEGFNLMAFVYYIASRLNVGTFALSSLDGEWTRQWIKDIGNIKELTIATPPSPLFSDANQITHFTTGGDGDVLWKMTALQELQISDYKGKVHIPKEVSALEELTSLKIKAKEIVIDHLPSNLEKLELISCKKLTLSVDFQLNNLKKFSVIQSSCDLEDLQSLISNSLQEFYIDAGAVVINDAFAKTKWDKLWLHASELIISATKPISVPFIQCTATKLSVKSEAAVFTNLESLELTNCNVPTFRPFLNPLLQDIRIKQGKQIVFDQAWNDFHVASCQIYAKSVIMEKDINLKVGGLHLLPADVYDATPVRIKFQGSIKPQIAQLATFGYHEELLNDHTQELQLWGIKAPLAPSLLDLPNLQKLVLKNSDTGFSDMAGKFFALKELHIIDSDFSYQHFDVVGELDSLYLDDLETTHLEKYFLPSLKHFGYSMYEGRFKLPLEKEMPLLKSLEVSMVRAIEKPALRKPVGIKHLTVMHHDSPGLIQPDAFPELERITFSYGSEGYPLSNLQKHKSLQRLDLMTSSFNEKRYKGIEKIPALRYLKLFDFINYNYPDSVNFPKFDGLCLKTLEVSGVYLEKCDASKVYFSELEEFILHEQAAVESFSFIRNPHLKRIIIGEVFEEYMPKNWRQLLADEFPGIEITYIK